MSGIGHNQGPSMEPGRGFRVLAWEKARKDLMGHIPVEVIRSRIDRAKELGLDYKTYASVRSHSGRDVIGFLFSSNALRLHLSASDLPGNYTEKLRALTSCKTMVAAHRPIDPSRLRSEFSIIHQHQLLDARSAPLFSDSWSTMREKLQAFARSNRVPSDTIVLVGDTGFEREWLAAGRFAGYLPAEGFFRQPELGA